ncbi:spherulin-1b precursor [Alternaria burnsii]|uniref:Spherulin-1b n=1 Tax=Alternaria burnsii TaxID=1187904 RepID=A0A8H7AXQ8_9PLEO|nr:spherulin-1b precursor [Alternaria burnsii]KAF7673461.1 spherulin-1b precursor [Alternaria burnsii]CAI9637807.1 unnamed protein product [Alternaria burnsii]
MFTITKVIVASLALGAVQALPQRLGARQDMVASASSAAPAAPSSTPDIFDDLLTAPTAIKRFQRLLTTGPSNDAELLTGDALRNATVFTFTKPAKKSTPGGTAVAANIGTFPILTGLGISTTVGFLEPCGINSPHVHPRATEFLTLVEGENLEFGYVLENQVVGPMKNPEIAGYLKKFQGTVFPQGSIHYQFNNDCKDATFVATLNSEDPGTSQIAQNFFALNPQVLDATLNATQINGKDIDKFAKTLPANLVQDVKVCLARCGL